jgi:hypothetical protein
MPIDDSVNLNVPASVTANLGVSTPISGVQVIDDGLGGETFTFSLSHSVGTILLNVNGVNIDIGGPSFTDGTPLTLAQINAAFATLSYESTTAGSDSIAITVTDSDGSTITKSIGVSTVSVVPTVTSISATSDTGTTQANTGNDVTVSVKLNEAMTVSGTPTLQLNDNEVATYLSGSGTNDLTFAYTVKSGDSTSDLNVTGLNLPSGASIHDSAGNALTTVSGDLGLQINSASNPTNHLTINLIWDSSVSNAPTGFEAAVTAAAQFLDNLIKNPITINIQVGWGEYDNGAYSIGNYLSLGGAVAGQDLTYSQLKSALVANASTTTDQSAVASLPSIDPTGGEAFFVSNAEAKALGLLPANGSKIDGAVGFNSTASWNYNTNDQAVPGATDLVSDAELELAHALGMELDSSSALMLFRYSAPGVRELTVNSDGYTTPAAYFSIDGGKTNLDSYLTTLDSTLWNSAVAGNDTFAAPFLAGQEHVFSLTDATELNVLGFNVNYSALASGGVINGTSGNETIYASALSAAGAATFVGGITVSGINYAGPFDTVVFDGPSTQYNILSEGAQGGTIADTVANRNGTHTFVNVEALQFTDQTIYLVAPYPLVNPSDALEAIYIGYFGRAGDPAGFTYWSNNFSLSQNQIAASFSVQAESTAQYPFLANPTSATPTQITSFIGSVYTDLFNRAADTSGLAYWQNYLTTNLGNPQAVGAFILAVIDGAQGSDQATIANKVTVADYFTEAFVAYGSSFNPSANALAHSAIASVTSANSSVGAAELMINDYLATLPSGLDVVGISHASAVSTVS